MPNEPTEELVLVPTPAAEWGKKELPEEEGFLVELPSGNVAKARRTLDLPVLLRAGRIPNPLASIVQKMIDTGSPVFPMNEIGGQALTQLLDLLDATTCKVMISPRVSRPDPQDLKESWEDYLNRIKDWKPEKDTISVFDIEMNDKFFLFALAQGAATDLASFREEQAAGMAVVSAGQSVGDEAKPATRASGANRATRRATSKKKP